MSSSRKRAAIHRHREDVAFAKMMMEKAESHARVMQAIAEEAARRRDEAEAKLAEAEKDAKRYSQVRRGQHWSVVDGIGNLLRGESLDAAIDGTIAAQEKP